VNTTPIEKLFLFTIILPTVTVSCLQLAIIKIFGSGIFLPAIFVYTWPVLDNFSLSPFDKEVENHNLFKISLLHIDKKEYVIF
jgi:hypothetical protein